MSRKPEKSPQKPLNNAKRGLYTANMYDKMQSNIKKRNNSVQNIVRIVRKEYESRFIIQKKGGANDQTFKGR